MPYETETTVVTDAPQPAPRFIDQVYLVGRIIVYISIICGPVLSFPTSWNVVDNSDTPRRLLLYCCAGFLVSILFTTWALRGRILVRWHRFDRPVGLFALAVLLCSLTSAYPIISWWGPLWSQDGMLFILTGILLYVGVKEFLRTPHEVEHAMLTMILVGGVIALIGLGDYFAAKFLHGYHGINPHFAGWRVVATLGNSMFTGTYFAVLIALGLGMTPALERPLLRQLVTGAVVLMLLALLLTQARAAWVGCVLTLPILFGMRRKMPRVARPISRLTWGTIGLSVILLAGVCVGIPSVRARVMSLGNMRDNTMQTRAAYITGALKLFLTRPVQGWGIGIDRIAFPQYRPSSMAIEAGVPLNRAYVTAHPHNFLAQLAAEMGLIGLCAFGFLLFTIVREATNAWRTPSRLTWLQIGLFSAIGTYLLTNLFAFDNAATMSLYWMALGMLATLTAKPDTPPERFPRFAQPLSARHVTTLTYLSAVLVLCIYAHTACELTAAIMTKQAMVYYAEGVRNLKAQDGANAQMHFSIAENTLGESLAFTAIPDWRSGIWTGDLLTYQIWTSICRSEMEMSQPDGTQADASRAGVYAAARQRFALYAARGLRMVDRDGIILRQQAQQALLDARVAGNARSVDDFMRAIQTGREVFATLHTVDPNCAEIYLLEADLLARQGEASSDATSALALFAQAEHQAAMASTLDTTFPEAYVRTAYDQSMQVEIDPSRATQLVPKLCANYQQAEHLGLALGPRDRWFFAKYLFQYALDPQFANTAAADTRLHQAITAGRLIHAEDRHALDSWVTRVARAARRPQAEIDRLLAAIALGATPPPLHSAPLGSRPTAVPN